MLYNTTNGHQPTEELTTILEQICNIAMPEPNISTCWDVANFCPLVVFVAGVRVVEFGPKETHSRRYLDDRWSSNLQRVTTEFPALNAAYEGYKRMSVNVPQLCWHVYGHPVRNAVITIAIRLRYDYDPTTTYRVRLLPFDAIRREQKWSIFRRSRIVVVSQLWYRLNREQPLYCTSSFFPKHSAPMFSKLRCPLKEIRKQKPHSELSCLCCCQGP